MRINLLCVMVLCCQFSFAQQPDTLIKKLDSLSYKPDTANNTNPEAYNKTTQLNLTNYFVLLASDLKQAGTKPFHIKNKNWKCIGIGLGTLALVSLADQPLQQFALDLRGRSPGLRNVSRFITNFGGAYEGYTLVALGLYGFIFKNEKMKTTTLLASQAYVVGATLQVALKFLTGRTRPSYYDPNTIAKPHFKGPFSKIVDYNGMRTNSSFPSGHSTVAFAAATVYALEYSNKPLVPILCYASATLIGLSRITENKHWATDVLAGGALGYLTGRLVVNNYHRYAKIKSDKQQKNSLSLSVGDNGYQITPMLVYHLSGRRRTRQAK